MIGQTKLERNRRRSVRPKKWMNVISEGMKVFGVNERVWLAIGRGGRERYGNS